MGSILFYIGFNIKFHLDFNDLEKRMRSSGRPYRGFDRSMFGFLRKSESLDEVIKEDEKIVRRIGLTNDKIADAILAFFQKASDYKVPVLDWEEKSGISEPHIPPTDVDSEKNDFYYYDAKSLWNFLWKFGCFCLL